MMYYSKTSTKFKSKMVLFLLALAFIVCTFFYYEYLIPDSFNKEFIFLGLVAIPIVGLMINFERLQKIYIYEEGMVVRPTEFISFISREICIYYKEINRVVASRKKVKIFLNSGEVTELIIRGLVFVDTSGRKHSFTDDQFVKIINSGIEKSKSGNSLRKIEMIKKESIAWRLLLIGLLFLSIIVVMYISIINNEGSIKNYMDDQKLLNSISKEK